MIRVEGLTKDYRGLRAVDNISFTCEPGTVTGFLGPNGAGKSTTLRIMTGLTPADGRQGDDRRGARSTTSRTRARRSASCSTPRRSTPAALAAKCWRSGAATMGLPVSRVEEMLNLVSLTGTEAKRRIRNYSLGMRQRLGIAHALLGDPKVLDPRRAGERSRPGRHPLDARASCAIFADRGGTVLLSSHLLHEIEIIADEIIVIGRGKIVAQGTKDELLKGAGTYVRATDQARARDGPGAKPASRATPKDEGFHVDATPEEAAKAAADGGVVLIEIRESSQGGLEEMFLELTSETQRDSLPRYGGN